MPLWEQLNIMTAQETSAHVKPCNIGQSEAHNRRDEVYLAYINEKKYLHPPRPHGGQ